MDTENNKNQRRGSERVNSPPLPSGGMTEGYSRNLSGEGAE